MKSERGNCEGGKKEEEKVKDKTGHVEVIQETVQGTLCFFMTFLQAIPVFLLPSLSLVEITLWRLLCPVAGL